MTHDHQRTRFLRQVAAWILAQEPLNQLTNPCRDDLITSLVRQWLTYQRQATLVSREEQYYVILIEDRNEIQGVNVEPFPASEWWDGSMRDWHFDEDQLEDALCQLNMGQSAEFENRDGIRVRVWTNPKERKKGIEPVEPVAPKAPGRRQYRKFAQDVLANIVELKHPWIEQGDLITSLVRQWLTYDGHAMILTEECEYRIRCVAKPDGGNEVGWEGLPTRPARNLVASGVASEEIPDLLHRLNSGQTPEITLVNGRRIRLSMNPRSGHLDLEPIDLPPLLR